jgi:hypothetical protein
MTFKMVALTSMFFAHSLRGWATDGRVFSRLTDPQGAGVVGATLRLAAISGAPVVEAASDRDGWFVIATVAPGDYEIRASAAGFDEVNQTGTRNRSRRDGHRCQRRSKG